MARKLKTIYVDCSIEIELPEDCCQVISVKEVNGYRTEIVYVTY